MFIKVMTERGFAVVDGVEHFEAERISTKGSPENSGIKDDRTFKVMISAFQNRSGCPIGADSDSFMSINYQNKTGEWCTINFNTIAWVCNENGKTVDVIHG